MTLTKPCLCGQSITVSLPAMPEADVQDLMRYLCCPTCASTPRPPLPPGRVETSPAVQTIAAILNRAQLQRDAATARRNKPSPTPSGTPRNAERLATLDGEANSLAGQGARTAGTLDDGSVNSPP
jgi:hypothetical protein